MPSPSVARKFLYEVHEEAKIEEAKQRRTAEQIAYIPEETEALRGSGLVNRELVRELGRRCPEQRIATVDQDATIIESRKQEALRASWLRLAMIAHNVIPALKRLALPAELLTARPKRLRFLIFNTPGRLVHHARRT